MYILATDVLAELRKAPSDGANPRVISWAKAQHPEELYISVISLLEIERGIVEVERYDAHQGRALRTWFQHQLKASFAPRTLAIDIVVAEHCASEVFSGLGSERNALLAATALAHKMTLVTGDTTEFVATGIPLLNPWS